jgi:AraC-like DNA-binding protein
MMSDTEQQTNDMIAAAADSSPSDFQDAFAAAMLDRIADSIEAKKIEMAKTYFNYEDDTETEVSDDTEEEPNEDTETAAGA